MLTYNFIPNYMLICYLKTLETYELCLVSKQKYSLKRNLTDIVVDSHFELKYFCLYIFAQDLMKEMATFVISFRRPIFLSPFHSLFSHSSVLSRQKLMAAL